MTDATIIAAAIHNLAAAVREVNAASQRSVPVIAALHGSLLTRAEAREALRDLGWPIQELDEAASV
jgi:hypothetical protein